MRRLTHDERETLKRLVSEARFAKTHPSKGLHGLAESCYAAAQGDFLLALAYATDAIKMRREFKPHHAPVLPKRRSFEEMFS